MKYSIFKYCFPENQPTSEWTVTHFRAVSLQVALRIAPEAIVPHHLRYSTSFDILLQSKLYRSYNRE